MLITSAYSESLRHPTFAVLLIKILLIFFFSATQKCSLVPQSSTLASDRIRGPTRFGKALNSSLFAKHAWLPSITQRFLVPVSTMSARNDFHNDLPTTKNPGGGLLPKKLGGGELFQT